MLSQLLCLQINTLTQLHLSLLVYQVPITIISIIRPYFHLITIHLQMLLVALIVQNFKQTKFQQVRVQLLSSMNMELQLNLRRIQPLKICFRQQAIVLVNKLQCSRTQMLAIYRSRCLKMYLTNNWIRPSRTQYIIDLKIQICLIPVILVVMLRRHLAFLRIHQVNEKTVREKK